MSDNFKNLDYEYLWSLYYESLIRTHYFTALSAKYQCHKFLLSFIIAFLSAAQLAIILSSNIWDGWDSWDSDSWVTVLFMWIVPILGFVCSFLGFYIGGGKLIKNSITSTHAQIAWNRASIKYRNLYYLNNQGESIKKEIENIQQAVEHIDIEAINTLTVDKKNLNKAKEEVYNFLNRNTSTTKPPAS